jgi:hypothetical protein
MIRMQSGRSLNRLLHHIAHDLEVRIQQVVAAHPRLARNPRRNHHHIRPRRVRIIVRPNNRHIALFNRHRLGEVQPLALRHALDHIDQHHIRQLLRRNPVRRRRPNIPRPNNRDLLPHSSNPFARNNIDQTPPMIQVHERPRLRQRTNIEPNHLID